MRTIAQISCRFLLVAALAAACQDPGLQFKMETDSGKPSNAFIARKEGRLVKGGATYYFSGANQYYFFYKDKRMVDDVMENARALGLDVMRTWAFCEGPLHDGFCFQPEPGIYHEPTFKNLDYTIYKASQEGIKLVLSLVNNWGGTDHFGGVDQYLIWVGGGLAHDDFFRNPKARQLYKDYVRHVLERVNSITGVKYKDDPTILMWELMNEPRADDKPSLYQWMDEMAGFIKGIDGNHLVTSGSEGGYVSDFYQTHKSKYIDVASLHLYPDSWGMSTADADAYLKEHIRIAHEELGKPVFLGEFAIKDKAARPEVYRKWYEIMDQGDINGALLWLLSGKQYGDPKNEGTLYPDYDGYTIYYPSSQDVCPLVSSYAQKVAQKRTNPQISLISPSPQKPVRGQIVINVAVSALSPILAMEYAFDKGVWENLASADGGYTAIFDTAPLADGNHLFTIRATDDAKRQTQRDFTLYVNNVPGNATLYIKPKTGKAPDFGEIYIADDENNIYLLVHRYDTPARPFSGNNYIYIDMDNDPKTGQNGYDHRINYAGASDHPQGYGDIFEWYYWNGSYWGYGHYWQASDKPPILRGNRKQEVLPTGTLAAANGGMMEFVFPKRPAAGQAATGKGVRIWIESASGNVASAADPIWHPFSSSQKVVIDGGISGLGEWNYTLAPNSPKAP